MILTMAVESAITELNPLSSVKFFRSLQRSLDMLQVRTMEIMFLEEDEPCPGHFFSFREIGQAHSISAARGIFNISLLSHSVASWVPSVF